VQGSCSQISCNRVHVTCLWIALCASTGLILLFGLWARPPLSWLLSGFSRPDLVCHAIAFVGLSLPAFVLFGLKQKVALSLVTGGAMLELLQLLTPQRHAALLDLLADAVGILLAAGVFLFVRYLGRTSVYSPVKAS
jgi:hypothetical protein